MLTLEQEHFLVAAFRILLFCCSIIVGRMVNASESRSV